MSSGGPGLEAGQALGTRARTVVLAAAFLGWMFAGVEMSLLPATTRPAIQDFMGTLDAGRGVEVAADRWFSWLLIAFLLGAAAGGALFGSLGDRIGRAKAMGASILCYSVFTGLGYGAATPEQLWLARFAACLGVGGMWPNGVALAGEAWPGISRPLLAGLIGCAANVGFLIVGWIMLHHPITRESWRWVLLVGASPALLGIFVLVAVPESPEWLAGRRRLRKDDAGTSANVRPRGGLREVFSRGYRGRTMLGIVLGTIPLLGGWASGQRLVPWAGQYGESLGWPDLKASTQIVQSVGSVLGSLAGGWIASWAGPRRSYFLVSLGSWGLSVLIFGFLTPGDAFFLPAVFLLGVVGVSYFGWLPYYLPGLFPTRIRATGAGVAYNFGRLFSAGAVLATAPLSALFLGDVGRMGLATSTVYALGLGLAWFIRLGDGQGDPA